MTPIVDGLEQFYSEQLIFKRINAVEGDGPAIMRDYRLPGHPTTLIFDSQGQEVQRFVGPQSVEVVEKAIVMVLD